MQHPVKVQYDDVPTSLRASIVGVTKLAPAQEYSTAYGYMENGKYGLATPDGKKITDALYTVCEESPDDSYHRYYDVVYYKVSVADPGSVDPEDPESVNRFGIIDAQGNELLPMQYCHMYRCNERFVCVYEATKMAENPGDALLYSGGYTSGDEDEVPIFEGEWRCYDLIEQKFVEGVGGTKSTDVYVYGHFFKIVSDEKNVAVNYTGEILPDAYGEAEGFQCGYYAIAGENGKELYDRHGNYLFTYPINGYTPVDAYDGYIKAKNNMTGACAVLDESGNLISAEFDQSFEIRGDLLYGSEDDGAYRYDGTPIIEGEFTRWIGHDGFTGQVWSLERRSPDGDYYIVVQKDGTVLFEPDGSGVTASVGGYLHFSQTCIRKDVDGKTMTYCLADRDFTIEGEPHNLWIAESKNEDASNSIFETITGEPIISGYKSYICHERHGSAMYVYADKGNGSYDIYVVE